MTGHDDLLARADRYRPEKGMLVELITELAAALRAVQADREIADAALENTRRRLDDLETAARDVVYEWDSGGEWIREEFESALNALRALLDVPAANTATMCTGGDRSHPFVPGIDVDDPDHPSDEWCNTCGERRDRVPAADTATRACLTCGGVRIVAAPDCDCGRVSSLNFALCPHGGAPCPDCAADTDTQDREWPRRVKVIPFTETDDVTWVGSDGKPRCARHTGVCLVPATTVGLTGDGHVCHQCMRETRPGDVPAADTATEDADRG